MPFFNSDKFRMITFSLFSAMGFGDYFSIFVNDDRSDFWMNAGIFRL